MRKRISVEEEFQRDMQDAGFRREYEALEDEFTLARALIKARTKSKLTQKEVAALMGTTQSAVARMESGRVGKLEVLQRYAKATGNRLEIRFVPADKKAAVAK
jgi:DNA-directed RNA polymerase specialized sigma subunit